MSSSFLANVNWRNATGDTPLIAACSRDHADVVKLLLVYGADATLTGQTSDESITSMMALCNIGHDSMTPLHIACSKGSLGIVNHLLEVDCGMDLTSHDGKTALDMAKFYGHQHIVRRLEQFMSSRSISRSSTFESPALSTKRQQLPALHSSPIPMPGSTTLDEQTYSLMESNYSLLSISSGIKANDCCEAFQRLFLSESKQRKVLEKKLEAAQNKITTLMNQLNIAYKSNNDLEASISRLNNECKYLKGDSIDEMTRIQCESFEKDLKNLLERIELRKVSRNIINSFLRYLNLVEFPHRRRGKRFQRSASLRHMPGKRKNSASHALPALVSLQRMWFNRKQ